MEPGHRARQLDLVDARQQVPIGDLHLPAREVRPQAEVLADAEAEVAIRSAVDPEGPRILEDLLVAVRRGIVERDGLALADQLVPQPVVV